MDKRKSLLNVSSAIVSRILLIIVALIVRRLLIQNIGNDVNGLDSLYTSIIGVLAVAELGIGSAIIFSMYNPIVQGDRRQVASLYFLYRKLYRIIGLFIFAAGCLILPFLPNLIEDYADINVNVYATFLLTLIAVILTYFYSAKSSLIEAYKDNYITTIILTASRLIMYGLQIVVLLLSESFVLYLVCQIVGSLVAWVLTEAVVRKKHSGIIKTFVPVDRDTRYEIVKNIKAMFMHRFGSVLIGSIDNLIISTFVGVVVLGKYSNYNYICSVMSGTIALFFTPLTSTVGHLCAQGNKEKMRAYFDHFYCMNYILGVVFFLGYYAVIHGVARLVFGLGIEVSQGIVFVITVSQFISFMRRSCLLFRDASGTFYFDRWKPAVEGLTNLILSLVFVQVFPEEYKVVGVIIATIITNLSICYIVEPYVVYKHAFGQSPWGYYFRNYAYTGIFVVALFILSRCVSDADGTLIGIANNGIISIAVSIGALVVVFLLDKKFRSELLTMRQRIIYLRR